MSTHISQCTFPKFDPMRPGSAKEEAASVLLWWQLRLAKGEPLPIYNVQEDKSGFTVRAFTLPVWVDNHELPAVFIESKFAA